MNNLNNNFSPVQFEIVHIFNDLAVYSVVITLVGLSFYMLKCYATYYRMNHPHSILRPVDAGRVEQDLPIDLELTPQNFIDNPELAEIFEGEDIENGLQFLLEGNEQFVNIENQIENANVLMRIHSIIENNIMRFNAEYNTLIENLLAEGAPDVGTQLTDILIRHYFIIEAFINSFFI